MPGCAPRVALLVLPCLLFTSRSTPLLAEESSYPAGHHPQVCTGYNPEADTWTSIGRSTFYRYTECPKNQAIFSIVTYLKRAAVNSPEHVAIGANCCPLPAEDILLDETAESYLSCPEGYVATGTRHENLPASCTEVLAKHSTAAKRRRCVDTMQSNKAILLCTKINDARYTLAPATPGLLNSLTGQLGDLLGETFTAWKHIPVGLRYGISRLDKTEQFEKSCIGQPWGSIYVGKSEKPCRHNFFRSLQYTGRPGDPPAGTPVKMFPDCLRLDNPLSPNPRCITEGSKENDTVVEGVP